VDLIALGCPLVRSDALERLMGVLVYLGHGVVDALVAALILALGGMTTDRRWRRAGLAALLAVVISGLLANLFKLLFALPRPTPSESFGFPSGHTSTAFALAGALGRAFPAAAPFLYLLAVLAAVARLYVRSHFVVDVIGGSLLGSSTGLIAALFLRADPSALAPRPRTRWAWVLPVALGIPALAFFGVYERDVSAHRLERAPAAAPAGGLHIAFGTPAARQFLLDGWSGDDGRWGDTPVAWALGREAALRLPDPAPGNHRLRLRLRADGRPADRPPCQVMEVVVNGAPVARLLLEKGWNTYEVNVPKERVRPGPNELRFRFAYAQLAGAGAPSAAFASLAIFPAGDGGR